VVHCEGKCPSCTSEGNDRLSKTNATTFEFIAKEEEDRDWNEIASPRHNDLFILHINRSTIAVLFGCSTGGIASDMSPANEDQISQLTFEQFFKEKK
jgi:hypothetical protein